MDTPAPHIEVSDLAMAYGPRVIMSGLTFTVNRGEVFVIMGGSGCGKSTLLRHLIGLQRPASGTIRYLGEDFTGADDGHREAMLRRFGVMYQGGALWTSMTLAENVALPLREYTRLSGREIADLVNYKLSLVGLDGFGDYYPAEISGGMVKRASLARAMALDPEILFLDEPGAGLDPISSKLLDDLVLELRDSLGTTVVMVTHELASIFAVADTALFLDTTTRTKSAPSANPPSCATPPENPNVRQFLNRDAIPLPA